MATTLLEDVLFELPDYLGVLYREAVMRFAVAASVILAGCSDPFAPTIENMAGTYEATTLSVTQPGSTTDFLAEGSSITLTLDTNGTVTGHLFIVGGAEGGGDLDGDMTGTWSLAASIVTFDQTADTFVRDVPFRASRGRLSAQWTNGAAEIRVVLTRM